MSFTIEFANNCSPNRRSRLSTGIAFSSHPQSRFKEPKPTRNLDSPLAQTPRTSDVHGALEPPAVDNDRPQLDPSLPDVEDHEYVPVTELTGEKLLITEYLGEGLLWDFWLAEHPRFGKVVLKVVYTPAHPCNDPRLGDYVAPWDILDEALKEEEFYEGPLKTLQGVVVPRYYGLYTDDEDEPYPYLAILLEYVGRSMGSPLIDLETEWKEKVYEAYKQLHLQGIRHFDVDGRHILFPLDPDIWFKPSCMAVGGKILKDDQTNIRLVGFRLAFHADIRTTTGVIRLLQEASCVRAFFGGERGNQLSLRNASPEYWARLEDPQAFKRRIDKAAENRGITPVAIMEHNMRLGVKYDENRRVIES